jgi:hypothetical protein
MAKTRNPEEAESKRFGKPESRSYAVQFSSPAAGRPCVFWAQGSTPETVVECWPHWDEQPFEQVGRGRRYGFGVVRKYMIYDRKKPTIRAALLLGEPQNRASQEIQEIVRRGIEWEGRVGKAEIRRLLSLFDEIAKIELRGRPLGTGRPKRGLPQILPEFDLPDKLETAGLTDAEMRVVYAMVGAHRWQDVAQKLEVSVQAVRKRWNKYIQPKLAAIIPQSSTEVFCERVAPSGAGQRWNKRPIIKDQSGVVHVRELERRKD